MQMLNLSGFDTLRYGACSQRTIYNFSDNSDRQGGRLYPSHGPLWFITSHSFRARLCHAKNEAPGEEAGLTS